MNLGIPMRRKAEAMGFALAKRKSAVAVGIAVAGLLGWYYFDLQDRALYAQHPVRLETDQALLAGFLILALLVWVLGHAGQQYADQAANLAANLADETRRLNEERHCVSFSFSPHAMWIYDLDTLQIVDVNESAIQKYGYRREDFLRLTIADIRPPEDIPLLMQEIKHTPAGFNEAGVWKHQRKDGSVMRVEICGYAFLAGQRKLELILANEVASSVDESSSGHERPALEDAPFGVIRSSLKDDRVLALNEAMLDILGYSSAEEFKNVRSPTALYHRPGDRERLLTTLQEKHRVVDFQVELLRKNGAPVAVSMSAGLRPDVAGDLSIIDACVRMVDVLASKDE